MPFGRSKNAERDDSRSHREHLEGHPQKEFRGPSQKFHGVSAAFRRLIDEHRDDSAVFEKVPDGPGDRRRFPFFEAGRLADVVQKAREGPVLKAVRKKIDVLRIAGKDPVHDFKGSGVNSHGDDRRPVFKRLANEFFALEANLF